MKETVVYLSSDQLVVVTAELSRDVLRVEDYFHLPFPVGAMINGVIINEDVVKQQLSEISKKGIQSIHLVIDSGQILAKNVVIPKMRNNQIYQFVKDELAPLVQSDEDMVYDYSFLEEDSKVKGASKILALGVGRRLIDTYVQLFKECYIHVLSIDYATNALIRFLQYLPGFIDKTYVVSQFDGNNMISSLFLDNEYALTYRSRIMANRGTPEFENEVINHISHMLQSNNRSDSTYSISEVIVFGMNNDEELSLCQNMSQQLHVEARQLPKSKLVYNANNSALEEFELSYYIYPVSVFFKKKGKGLKNKEIDLMAAYNRNDEPSRYEGIIKLSIPPLVILLVCLIPFGILTINNMSMQNQIDETNSEIEKYNLAIDSTDASAYEKLQSFQNVLTSIQNLNDQINSMSRIDSHSIQTLQNQLITGMTIESIQYVRETGTMSLGVSSTNVQNIEKYVKNLKKQDVFANVDYNAYSEVTSSTTSTSDEIDPLTGLPVTLTTESTSYKTTITIILK